MRYIKIIKSAMVVAIVLASIGFLMEGWTFHKGLFPRPKNELAWDLWQAGYTICNGPPWYVINTMNWDTPFDARWADGSPVSNIDYWSVRDLYMWKDYLKFCIAWFMILSSVTFAYQFSIMGVKKAWEGIRPKRK